jgi:tetrahydromethanopterin S-methyltransferase subunit B
MYIQVLPEYGLVVDPMVGLLTSAGESFGPVIEKVEVIEAISNDLVNMLSGKGDFLATFPGRDKSLGIAGGMTSFWYGMAIGLLIAGIVAFQLLKVG